MQGVHTTLALDDPTFSISTDLGDKLEPLQCMITHRFLSEIPQFDLAQTESLTGCKRNAFTKWMFNGKYIQSFAKQVPSEKLLYQDRCPVQLRLAWFH